MKNSISTNQMDRHNWLSIRKKGIGGSDVAAILSLNPYKTPFEVWQEKTSEEVIAKDENSAMEFGSRLEDVVADKYSDVTGNIVHKDNKIRFHKDSNILLANIDRLIIADSSNLIPTGILEIKTVSSFARKYWETDIPLSYYCQLQHYLSVTGYTWGDFAILEDGRKFIYLNFTRDEDYIHQQNEALISWFNKYVTGNTPPPFSAAELSFISPKSSAVEATAEVMKYYNDLKEIKNKIASLDDEKKQLEDSLKLFIGENEVLTLNNSPLITWKAKKSNRFDTKSFQQDHIDLYQKYLSESYSRTFLVKEL